MPRTQSKRQSKKIKKTRSKIVKINGRKRRVYLGPRGGVYCMKGGQKLYIQGGAGWFGDKLKSAASGLANAAKSAASGVANAAKSAASGVANAARSAASRVGNTATDAYSTVAVPQEEPVTANL